MTQPLFLNYCKWNASTAGTGPFTVGSAAAADDAGPHDVPLNCSVVNGTTYRYYAQSSTGTQTELGRGGFNTATNQLLRTEIIANSDGTLSPVNFSTPPIVDMYPSPSTQLPGSVIQPGTRMAFQQSAAPLGFTKDFTYNDFCPRIVNGNVTSGGAGAFSFVFSYRTSDNHTLTVNEIASHQHGPQSPISDFMGDYSGTPGFGNKDSSPLGDSSGATSGATAPQGGNAGHVHTTDMRVWFVDFIIAVKS